jgi:hypothetical protein
VLRPSAKLFKAPAPLHRTWLFLWPDCPPGRQERNQAISAASWSDVSAAVDFLKTDLGT